MKQGLSLRVSQHLALTPQLQQSIRLLQLSTLELAQEVQQMLDDNPFLEASVEDAGADEPAPPDPRADAPAIADALPNGHDTAAAEVSESGEAEPADAGAFSAEDAPGWEGDGSTEVVADDGEWGDGNAVADAVGGLDDQADGHGLAG